ncbi:MAG TPA: formyltransferase [Burkholderiales bacterium]|nr:formyltransferase [Burkholderiales bacterium]
MAKAVVFGYHDVGVRCLGALLAARVDVPLVVTHRDDPQERIWFASVASLARSKGIDTLLDPDIGALLPRLRTIAPDFIFSFYYRRMLPPEVLASAKRGAYNMHGSLLPKYRGRAPVNWAVLNGETETGATLHEMVAKPDAGRIVDQQAVPIGPDDLAVDVFRGVTDAAETVMSRSIGPLLAGKAKLRPNDLAKGSYYGGRRPEDGRIDWTKSARAIHNLVRAVAPPYPGAFCERLKIHRTQITDRSAPGRSVGPFQDANEWFALCGDGKVLRLLEVEERK